MSQSRNKLIHLFVGNMANSAVHRILEKAIDDEIVRNHYNREFSVSFDVAKRYRDKINPRGIPLPEKDVRYVKDRITRRVNAELRLRISKGYQNINLKLVNIIVDELLRDTKVV